MAKEESLPNFSINLAGILRFLWKLITYKKEMRLGRKICLNYSEGKYSKMTKREISIYEGNHESAKYIQKRLIEFNIKQVPFEGTIILEPINVVMEDGEGQIVGGINATIIQYWSRCHIDTFWIDEQYRGNGYGRKLLENVEKIAFDKGCKLIQLETYSFQAPNFYIKNGYEIIGVVKNHPEEHSQYFLKKVI